MTVTAFLTDSTLCIGCKACEVACKEWNDVPADAARFSGLSYDNTSRSATRPGGTSSSSRMTPECGKGGNAPGHSRGSSRRTSASTAKWRAASSTARPGRSSGRSSAACSSSRTSATAAATASSAVRSASSTSGQTMGGRSSARSATTGSWPGFSRHAQKPVRRKSILFGEMDELRREAANRDRRAAAPGEWPMRVLYDPRDSSVGGIHSLFIVRGDPRNVQPAVQS